MEEIIGRFPTIPEYYKLKINSAVDLTMEPKQCCPFHKETMPSWSYSAERGTWRCFGSCKCGGGVVKLHQKNYNLSTVEEAEESLRIMFRVPREAHLTVQNVNQQVNEDKVEFESLLLKAELLTDKKPERYIELDYVMSKYPVSVIELRGLLTKWTTIQ